MNINGIKSTIDNINLKGNCFFHKKNNANIDNHYSNSKNHRVYSSENIRANYAPVSFKGNAPRIKNAYIITGEQEDLPLLVTKKNESYVIDFDSQTEIIYGIDAVKYLDGANYFHYDTQVIFPKKAEGVLHIKGQDIPLAENSAVMINADTNANVEVKKGFPMMIISKKDYDWYERYGKNAQDINIRNKFLELMYYNSHLYNGEFTPNVLLPEKLRDEVFLKSISIDKWAVRNNLVNELYSRKEVLSQEDRDVVEQTKKLLDKLFEKQIITQKDDGYVRFSVMYNKDYMRKYLQDNGFTNEEISLLSPIYNQSRQVHIDSKFSHRNPVKDYSSELVEKMKEKGILYSNKKDSDKWIYWRECFGNEESLRKRLSQDGFSVEEQEEVVRNWHSANNTGFDISGLKFIDENVAVYNLNDKLNNWTHEKTNWVTNSTAIASTEGKTPFIGVSMVQTDENRPIKMSELRREEKLHAHPNLEEKRQTEIYVITSGAAALNVVKEGKSCVKILKEGELAVVGPGVAHCVNSILGEYEHIVAQVPSAFQYGFSFKSIVDTPEDYNEEILQKKAFEELRKISNNG